MSKTTRTYTYEVKKKAVELFFEGHPPEYIMEKFEIKNRRSVYEWVEKVRNENSFDALLDKRGLSNKDRKKKETVEEEIERLKLENLYLKKLLQLRKG